MTSLVVKQSASSYSETTRRLLAAIQRRGLTVFAHIDHAAAAREVGLEFDEEGVFLFGDPRGGTPLMLSDRRIGIELPLRILIWREAAEVLVAYGDPREFSDFYDVAEHWATLERMAKLLEELASETAS
jgi:uncharacterized protein (DUF302 family)